MKYFIKIYLFCLMSAGCHTSTDEKTQPPRQKLKNTASKKASKTELYYTQNKGNDSASISTGSYGNGKLINGKLIPFKGSNFEYFSEASYLIGRAYLNDKVLKVLLEAYQEMEKLYPGKIFYIMETSHKKGGNFYPHHTHQNGLSVDLMVPMIKNGEEYLELDHMGIPHYWLEFDENGRYQKDTSIQMNFDLVAHHLLILQEKAKMNGCKIARVHFKLDVHDELLSTPHGKQLSKNGIYLTQGLSQTISEQHDDHFHVDFSID